MSAMLNGMSLPKAHCCRHRAAVGATPRVRHHPQVCVRAHQRLQRRALVQALAADAASPTSTAAWDRLLGWCIEVHQLPAAAVEPALVEVPGGLGQQRPGFVAVRDVQQGEVLLQIPGDLGVSEVDVAKEAALGPLIENRSELVGLALWLMLERSKVGVLLGGWVGCGE